MTEKHALLIYSRKKIRLLAPNKWYVNCYLYNRDRDPEYYEKNPGRGEGIYEKMK